VEEDHGPWTITEWAARDNRVLQRIELELDRSLVDAEGVALLEMTESGLYCAAGDFHVDPWKAVDRALTTHAHSDHARGGSRYYLCSADGVGVLRQRLGGSANISSVAYGESLDLKGVRVSFHPAGHLLGSAQIRLEFRGEVWVVSGDYKLDLDPTCRGFEPVPCHTFVTESTFGLPVYRWPTADFVFREIHEWWAQNQREGLTSVLFGYSLGKAQRLLAGLDANQGPIFVHNAVEKLLPAYQAEGVVFPAMQGTSAESVRDGLGKGIVIAAPGTEATKWIDGFGDVATASASGWMLIRGMRGRQGARRGFVLSDHADWDGLVSAIRATGADRVLVTHGYTRPLVRWLREHGWEAEELQTRFNGEGPGALDAHDLEPPLPVAGTLPEESGRGGYFA